METNIFASLTRLSNDELLSRLDHLVQREREATASLVAHLAEFDARGLYRDLGCSSLFTYCTQVLHFSDDAAYFRIQAARAVQEFPAILEKLAEGSVHLTAVSLLRSHLTEENHRELLEAARHRSKREVEELIARIRPLPPVPASVRKLPAQKSALIEGSNGPVPTEVERTKNGATSSEPPVAVSALMASSVVSVAPATAPRPAVVTPLAPDRYRIQVTASAETCEKLRRAQDLLRHQIPDGDPAVILDRALTVLLEQLEKRKLAATSRPRVDRPGTGSSKARASTKAPAVTSKPHHNSRHIPAEVKRTVWARDEGQCAFRSRDGRRCAERGRLEFHHIEPYAVGGLATTENIALRCRTHNVYEAEMSFGRRYPTAVRDRRPEEHKRWMASNSVRTELMGTYSGGSATAETASCDGC